MAIRADLIEWVAEALVGLGGKARIVSVAEEISKRHEQELRSSGSLFYTWQYDMRWAAYVLRKRGRLLPEDKLHKGVWVLGPIK